MGVRGDSRVTAGAYGVYSPALDKVLEVVGPEYLVIRLVLELGDRLPHDICQEVDEAGAGLHLRAVCREGEAMLGDLQERDARRPDVGRDGVRLARDSLRRHVV